jgi:SAM-dependent methyltransferase
MDVDGFATAERVATILQSDGFERWETWTGGAQRSFARHADHLTLARTDDETTVVRVSWKATGARTRRQRLIAPTPGDWQMVALPSWAWRAYPMVRIVRLVAERLRLRPRHEGTLGPFLATPSSLLSPLLHHAGTSPSDVVLDLGCGDGRLPVTAALGGSRSIGVERSPELADRARQRAVDAGVADLVTIVTGDAREAVLDDVDVVFAFLPTDVLADLLPSILHRLRPGGRLIAHEQNRLPAGLDPRPTNSSIVVSDDAITVAHRWDV